MLAHGLRLPDCPIGDGRWHECDGGQYLMFPNIAIAIFCGGGEDSSPIVWQHEPRLLTLALEQRIADAIARRPMPRKAPRGVARVQEANAAFHSNQDMRKAEPPSSEGGSLPAVTPAELAEEAGASKSTDGRHPTVRPVDPEVFRMFGVRPGSAVARAMEALAEWLATGPVRTIEIKERAKQRGFSWATMRRAADVLRVCVVRDGWGAAGSWWWSRRRQP